jgi:hypothetical protein
MKKNVYLISILFVLNACGTLNMVQIEEPVIKVYTDLTGSKEELFVKANDWMIGMFVDASSVIQFSDKEEGVLIGKYLMNGETRTISSLYGSSSIDSRIYAKIDIRVKDDGARISIEPLSPWRYDESGLTIFDYSKEKFYEDMDRIMLSFYNAIKADKIQF